MLGGCPADDGAGATAATEDALADAGGLASTAAGAALAAEDGVGGAEIGEGSAPPHAAMTTRRGATTSSVFIATHGSACRPPAGRA